jgi:hypothetical protein
LPEPPTGILFPPTVRFISYWDSLSAYGSLHLKVTSLVHRPVEDVAQLLGFGEEFLWQARCFDPAVDYLRDRLSLGLGQAGVEFSDVLEVVVGVLGDLVRDVVDVVCELSAGSAESPDVVVAAAQIDAGHLDQGLGELLRILVELDAYAVDLGGKVGDDGCSAGLPQTLPLCDEVLLGLCWLFENRFQAATAVPYLLLQCGLSLL